MQSIENHLLTIAKQAYIGHLEVDVHFKPAALALTKAFTGAVDLGIITEAEVLGTTEWVAVLLLARWCGEEALELLPDGEFDLYRVQIEHGLDCIEELIELAPRRWAESPVDATGGG